MTPNRVIKFIKRHLLRNPRYFVMFLCSYLRKDFVFNTKLISEEELTDFVTQGKSLIRLGDGEINLMLGLPNHYQSFSPVLKSSLFEIVQNYNHDSNYIISVPRFINCTNTELRKMSKFQVWLPLKVMFGLHFNKRAAYLDAHAFYYDGYFERTVGWAIRDKNIVLITNKKTIVKQKNNKKIPWTKVTYIETPEFELLTKYGDIKEDIDLALSKIQKKETVLLFAMGPVGKKLAYEYSKEDIQSIDIGKVAEVMYTGESISYII